MIGTTVRFLNDLTGNDDKKRADGMCCTLTLLIGLSVMQFGSLCIPPNHSVPAVCLSYIKEIKCDVRQ